MKKIVYATGKGWRRITMAVREGVVWGSIIIHHRISDEKRWCDCPRRKGSARAVDLAHPWTHFREATWDDALDYAAAGPGAEFVT